MTRATFAFFLSLLISSIALEHAAAETTGWQNREDFRVSVYTLTEKGMVPTQIAARIENGEAQFKANWEAYRGPEIHSGFALYPLESREDADIAIKGHQNTGGNIEVDELCLAKLAKAIDGDAEAWLVLLQETEGPGVRCINLPPR